MVKKKIQFAGLALFAAVIVFFSIFGETLYTATKPKVTVTGLVQYTTQWGSFVGVPKTVCTDGKVYVIKSEPGFSVVLNRVVAVAVETEDANARYDIYDDVYEIISGVSSGERIVKNASRPLKDGEYVIIIE